MNRNWKFVLILVLILIIIGTCACNPTQVVSPPTYTAPSQQEDTVHLEGDSATLNTYLYRGVLADYATSWSYFPGASIDASQDPDGPAMTRVPRLIQEGKVDDIVWALGLNEISKPERWSLRYQLLWTDLLGQKLPSSSCIVMVKPWVLPSNYAVRPLSALNSLRTWMDEFAASHSNVVLVDWKPILEAHPEFSQIDGVHIDTNEGSAARDAMYREGLSHCG